MRPVDGTRRAVALAVAGSALYAVPAYAEATAPPLIWYRSAEGCPDGQGFLARLAARGVEARLAVVGDPIDFVVTLGSGAEGARGLLERQTKTGTVAIRRLDGGTCDEIADGLALSLSLADAPEERRREAPERSVQKPVEATPAPLQPTEPPFERAVTATAPAARDSRARVSIGIQANVVSGVAPEPMPGVSLFVDFAPGGSGLLSRSSARAGAFGYTGASSTDAHDYEVWLAGGRVGACPAWFGGSTVRVHPCVSVDLGTIRTAGSGPTGRATGAFWGAARLGLRLELHVSERIALEAQADAQFPFTRYEIVAGPAENTLYRTAAAGFGGGLGAYFTLP
jgi:hypothetical protein